MLCAELHPILMEAVRAASLYHATKLHAARFILEENMVRAQTFETINGKETAGVSLTRDMRFAQQFRHADVLFEFDARCLQTRNRLVPHDYFGVYKRDYPDEFAKTYHKSHERQFGGAEAEEFHVGPIKDVNRCLLAVHLSGRNYRFVEDDPEWDALTKHPKLVVKFAAGQILRPNLTEAVAIDTTLYHATPSKNVALIRRQGLQPRQGQWGQTYPTPRIYLVQDSTDAYIVAGEMIQNGVPEVTVLEVDVGNLAAEFEPDPDWLSSNENVEHPAVYTEQPIPPEAIRRVAGTYTADDYDP